MLKDCIPSRYANTKQIKELFLLEEKELERIYKASEKLYRELLIGLTVDNVERYEKEYGLKEDNLLSLNQKKARILAKKNTRIIPKISNFSVVIKNLLNADEVVIKEVDNELLVYVKTANLVENMKIATDWLHNTRPAHIGYKFVNNLNRASNCDIYFLVGRFKKKRIKVVV